MNDCVKKYLITTPMLICLAFSGACRSTDKESFKTAQLNQYDQIDTLSRGDPDSRGIITYDTYQILHFAYSVQTMRYIIAFMNVRASQLSPASTPISQVRWTTSRLSSPRRTRRRAQSWRVNQLSCLSGYGTWTFV